MNNSIKKELYETSQRDLEKRLFLDMRDKFTNDSRYIIREKINHGLIIAMLPLSIDLHLQHETQN